VGVATGPVKSVIGGLRGLDWTWRQVGDWVVCTYVCISGGGLNGPVGCWPPLEPGVLKKKTRAALELHGAIKPCAADEARSPAVPAHTCCSAAVQAGPGGAGPCWRCDRRPSRTRFLRQLPIWPVLEPGTGGELVARRAPSTSPARRTLCVRKCWKNLEGGRSPAVFTCTWYSASRLPEARGRACAQAAGASCASCRSDSMYMLPRSTLAA
jgi:hypothetical protein